MVDANEQHSPDQFSLTFNCLMRVCVCIQAEEMIEYIRNAFKNNIKQLDWMNEQTKKVATEKVNSF